MADVLPEKLHEVVVHAAGHPMAAWADGLRIRLPDWALQEGLRHATVDGRLVAERVDPGDPRLTAIAGRLRLWRAFTAAPTSSRLPFSYRSVPAPIRALLAHGIGRVQRRRQNVWARFPAFPLDLTCDVLLDLGGAPSPWRDGPTPVLLSHDLDTAEGLDNLVRLFLDLEEAAGARSTSFIVPCSWPLDEGLLNEARDRGHTLGIHGYDHSNLTPFAEPRERARRLDAPRELVHRHQMRGYRAPSLVRTPALLDGLAERYAWDSSIPTSGGLFPMPNNGCATARPFHVGRLPEIPLSMPRDGSLRFLGYGAPEIARQWIEAAELIARSGGVVVLLTHCEARFSGNPPMLDAYRRFLDHVAQNDHFFFSTFDAVAAQLGLAREEAAQ